MKSRYRLSAPRLDRRTALPATLAALLLLAMAVQLAAPTEVELPPALPIASIGGGQAPVAMPIAAPALILARPLFAPRGADASGAAPLPLGGAVVAGTIAVRGRVRAVLRRPDGAIFYLPIGGAIDGWRLTGLTAERALFRKGSEQLALQYGAAPVAAPAQSEDEGEDAEE